MAEQNSAELDAFVKVLLARVDTGRLQMEIEQRDRELNAKSAESASSQPA